MAGTPILSRISDTILNLLFPPRCGFCEDIIGWVSPGKYRLCESCVEKISFIGEDACRYCGKQLSTYGLKLCDQCTEDKYFSMVVSACEYSGLIREKLIEHKFKGNKQLYKVFASLVIEKFKMTNDQEFDIIISVPMHSSKFAERGYNQSELIAVEISRYFSIPVSINNLIKSRPTQVQSKLDKRSRMVNVNGAFGVVCSDDIKDKKVLLIDDIITTGATINECSRVLLEAGAREVYAATVATGRNDLD